MGEAKVQVEYQGQTAELSLIIAKDDNAPTLFGRDWLGHLKLNWPSIKRVSCGPKEALEKFLSKHSQLFQEGLGTLQGVEAKLHLREGATPKFKRARPVSYAL